MPRSYLDAILLCPTGQDAYLIAEVLKKGGMNSKIVKTIEELCALNFDEAGLFLIAEEAFTIEGIDEFNRVLSLQKPWSDIPIILLTSRGAKNQQFRLQRLEVFVASGNVTLLERPLQPITIISSTQVALRSRKRQFQVRDLLVEQVAATKIRDEFISIASHELKTPLTSLKLQTQMTTKIAGRPGSISPERMQKQLNYTTNQIERLNRLVDDMLDISRINTGKLQLNLMPCNLSDLVEELIERFQPQFEAVGCIIESNIGTDVVGNWDSYKIEQVINNLFSNAIRYSPQSKIEISLKTLDKKAILNVKDNGKGIEKENLDRVFERFERATTEVSGLGLGLYITRQILELHKGKIFVESEYGKGANFVVELPLID